jgi:hypothetical protein
MTREQAAEGIRAILSQLPPSESHNVLVDVIQITNAQSEQRERTEFDQRRQRILEQRRAMRPRAEAE